MEKAAKELDFYAGSKMRDEIKKITRTAILILVLLLLKIVSKIS
jgi:hypothetical protein